jgi:hypothetical protein
VREENENQPQQRPAPHDRRVTAARTRKSLPRRLPVLASLNSHRAGHRSFGLVKLINVERARLLLVRRFDQVLAQTSAREEIRAMSIRSNIGHTK